VAKGFPVPKRDNIVDLFPAEADTPEIQISQLRKQRPQPGVTDRPRSALDLSAASKLVMVMGPGRAGKTTLVRWMVERAQARYGAGEGPPVVLATADADRPALQAFFPDANAPGSPGEVDDFLGRLISHVMTHPKNVLVDFGADRTLAQLVTQIPTLEADMNDAGVTPVLFYLMTPRAMDLTTPDQMEISGFKPSSTVLVLNMGTIEEGKVPEREFASIRANSTYRAMIERGAAEIWMPRLYSHKPIEERLLSLRAAAEKDGGLPWLEMKRTAAWLNYMETAFSPIATWLP
jgi:hypothetical protein